MVVSPLFKTLLRTTQESAVGHCDHPEINNFSPSEYEDALREFDDTELHVTALRLISTPVHFLP